MNIGITQRGLSVMVTTLATITLSLLVSLAGGLIVRADAAACVGRHQGRISVMNEAFQVKTDCVLTGKETVQSAPVVDINTLTRKV